MRLSYHPSAEAELVEAACFYERKVPGLAVIIQLGMGSARVPRAAGGVPPLVSSSQLALTVWWFSQAEESLQRDAANHMPEACAPHLQLHGYG